MNALVERCWRGLGYFAVLRPAFVFGFIVFFLPLTAFECTPANSMLGNLFVEYGFQYGFWFSLALFGAVWAVMLTACLTLDIERDRPDRWVYDPLQDGKARRVTSPIHHRSTFVYFSLLGVPGVAVVILKANHCLYAAGGVLLGGCLAYLLMDSAVYLGRCNNPNFQLFPWPPLFGRPPVRQLGWINKIAAHVLSWIARAIFRLPADIFQKPPAEPLLEGDHLFAAMSLLEVSIVYLAVYWLLKPGSWTKVFEIASLPPAAFIYALLLPLIWLISAFWIHLKRYRIMLLGSILIGFILYGIGDPAHTYDVFAPGTPTCPQLANDSVLRPHEVWDALRKLSRPDGEEPSLILVSASGGGILAAGWTAKVLTELDKAYPDFFAQELRLISAVSGGSVGTAHYVNALSERGGKLSHEVLYGIVEDAMTSSLSITAYGVAFPDFRRALFPIWTNEAFDRGRLLEADWRKTANMRRGGTPEERVLLSEWTEAIKEGKKPAVIFNTTVMETGERIAITPLSSLKSKWAGEKLNGPERHNYARTLSEFLDNIDIDVWTAARLSATFSYVSPAARAAFAKTCQGKKIIERSIPTGPQKNGLLHMIDGGYHDNSGVASALDWLDAALQGKQDTLPFSRLALVEIRAKPDIPKEEARDQWNAAWLGPFWGLMNSWGFTQTSSNDTAVNRLIERFNFKEFQSLQGKKVRFQPFVFVPVGKGPLSWHLSNAQKRFVHDSWLCQNNQDVLKEFLDFVDPQAKLRAPLVSAPPRDPTVCKPQG